MGKEYRLLTLLLKLEPAVFEDLLYAPQYLIPRLFVRDIPHHIYSVKAQVRVPPHIVKLFLIFRPVDMDDLQFMVALEKGNLRHQVF